MKVWCKLGIHKWVPEERDSLGNVRYQRCERCGKGIIPG